MCLLLEECTAKNESCNDCFTGPRCEDSFGTDLTSTLVGGVETVEVLYEDKGPCSGN